MNENRTSVGRIDLRGEIGALLEHVARTGIAIRMHSSYGDELGQGRAARDSDDLYVLADSLHNLDLLGRAITSGSTESMVFACDLLIEAHDAYGKGNPAGAKATIERVRKYGLDLPAALKIFRAIRQKALRAAREAAGENLVLTKE